MNNNILKENFYTQVHSFMQFLRRAARGLVRTSWAPLAQVMTSWAQSVPASVAGSQKNQDYEFNLKECTKRRLKQ